MRLGLAVASIAVLATACTLEGGPAAVAKPTASSTPFSGVTVTPAVGLTAIVGWDGVDQSVMLVAPVENTDIHQIDIGVWLLTGRGWRPMPSPSVLADERGFGQLTLAYDSDRHVELLTSWPGRGYYDAGPTTISEWDGRSWREVAPTTAPSRGFLFGAYSPDLRALVGVENGSHGGDDTWLYDANGWRRAQGGGSVFLQGYPRGLAYDPTHHAILALDGSGRTWKFDGTTWTKQDLNPPTPVGGGSVTFDSQHGRWILFGGSYLGANQEFQPLAQTWIGDGTSWTRLTPTTSPPVRSEIPMSHTGMAWDPVGHRAVLFGGFFGFCCDVVYKDTWAWDGKTWHKLLDTPPLAMADQIPAPPPCTASTASYGLLMVASSLQVIDTCGKVAASAPVSPPSVDGCTAGGPSALLPPPVSASDHKVYFRDGDTHIRSLALDGTTSDVTTVPGGLTTVSFVSVTPDDQRIAVVVEDFSAETTVAIRLYVEDLVGHGHHFDIYATTVAKSGGTTLWPVGWHANLLVLGVLPVCGADFSSVSPSEWHLVDPATGNRMQTISAVPLNGPTCVLGRRPSSAGDTCTGGLDHTVTFNWQGAEGLDVSVGFSQLTGIESGLSPDGRRVFVSSLSYGNCGGSNVGTCIVTGVDMPTDSQRRALAEKRLGCLWIDNDHILAADAVLEMPSTDFPKSQYAPVIPLEASGVCAGRFPGGLG